MICIISLVKEYSYIESILNLFNKTQVTVKHLMTGNELLQYLEENRQESTKILIADEKFIQTEPKLLKYLKKNQKEYPKLVKVFFNAFPTNFPKELHFNDLDESKFFHLISFVSSILYKISVYQKLLLDTFHFVYPEI
ncbi:hypothetical protein M0812_30360 [Anaeramoeba flamelloides]|uniref:Uncharacterized protein n=1 Tax=Anaeramoeba flamelloides TaxID=1746091 RepID=A0AAV7Y2R0_9EUKA|nr:hypothetical protein M0812_30360 [Anaeramoeba flamelloides]